MRKSRIIIEGLQRRVKEAEAQRDEARGAVNEGLTRLHEKVAGISDGLSAVRRDVKAHSAALSKHGDDLSGLAQTVRAAVKPPAVSAPEPGATPVTPIKSRSSKAAG